MSATALRRCPPFSHREAASSTGNSAGETRHPQRRIVNEGRLLRPSVSRSPRDPLRVLEASCSSALRGHLFCVVCVACCAALDGLLRSRNALGSPPHWGRPRGARAPPGRRCRCGPWPAGTGGALRHRLPWALRGLRPRVALRCRPVTFRPPPYAPLRIRCVYRIGAPVTPRTAPAQTTHRFTGPQARTSLLIGCCTSLACTRRPPARSYPSPVLTSALVHRPHPSPRP